MKKIMMFLSFFVLLLVGCTNNASNVVLNADKKMNELDSFSMKMNFEASGANEEEDVNVSIILDGKIDIKNSISALTVTTDMGIFNFSIDMYISQENGKVITYAENPFGVDEWTKTVVDVDDIDEKDMQMFNNPQQLLDVIDKATQFKEVKSDLDNAKKYELTIANADLKDFVVSNGSYMGTEEDVFNEKGNTTLMVYVTNDGYIGRMVLDLKELAKSEEGITKMLFTFDFSKFNETSVTIPTEVMEKAVLDTSIE